MAKVTAPLLSLGASGTIGKTQTFATWRGVKYVRSRVVPKNPQTTAQTNVRNVFSNLSAWWKQFSADAQAPWIAYAQGKPVTDRNAFNMFNVGPMNTAADNNVLVGSPGANAGISFTSATLSSPSAGVLHLAFVAPTPPTGWTFVVAAAVVILVADPTTVLTNWTSESVTGASSALVVSGLATGTYVGSIWPVWTKPDGSTAYGPSITGTQAVA